MLVTGAAFHDPIKCRLMQVTTYLMMQGSVGFLHTLIIGAAFMMPPYLKNSNLQLGAELICHLLLLSQIGIYGLNVIVAESPKIDFRDPSSEKFCGYTPFLWVYTSFIVQSILLPITAGCARVIFKRI